MIFLNLLPKKKCTKCKKEFLSITEFFTPQKNGKNGLSAECRGCRNKRSSEYRITNKKKCQTLKALWYKANKEKMAQKAKKYYQKNKKIILKRQQGPDAKKRRNNLRNKRYKKDLMYKFNVLISNSIRQSLSVVNSKNGISWERFVDFTKQELIEHLEALFVEGMSWNNYGKTGWHIDHKIPISVFNFIKPEHEDFKRCWDIDNLQPMWATENMSKHTKLTKHFQPSLLI